MNEDMDKTIEWLRDNFEDTQAGGCFKDLNTITRQQLKDFKLCKGEKEMNEMTIEDFKALVVADDDVVEGKLYRATGAMPDPESTCVKRGALVFALRCISVTGPSNIPPHDKLAPKVEMGLEEFILIADDCVAGPPEDRQPVTEESIDVPADFEDWSEEEQAKYMKDDLRKNIGPPVTDESEDCPSLIGDRIYWARNRVAMKAIKQALIAFLFEADSPENRQTIARICTVRIQEDYPDCNMVLEHTPEDILNKKYHFILTEGSRVVHYGADFITANDAIYAGLGKKATRDVRVDITGEENNGE